MCGQEAVESLGHHPDFSYQLSLFVKTQLDKHSFYSLMHIACPFFLS